MKRYNNFDLFRCFCLFGVFALHMQRESLLHQFAACLGTMSVPSFFMMSGALLLADTREYSILEWIKKTWNKLMIPWILAILLYTLEGFGFQYLHTGNIDYMIEIQSFSQFGYPTRGWHLWYMYAIIEIYLCIPLLKILRWKNKIVYYLVGIGTFVFSIVCNESMIELPWFLRFIHYIIYYILGDFIFSYCSSSKKTGKIIINSIGILLLCILFYNTYINFYFDYNFNIFDNSYILVIMVSILMLVFVNMNVQFGTYYFTKFFLPIYILHIFVGDFWSGISRMIGFDSCQAWWALIVDCVIVFCGCYVICIIGERLKQRIELKSR